MFLGEFWGFLFMQLSLADSEEMRCLLTVFVRMVYSSKRFIFERYLKLPTMYSCDSRFPKLKIIVGHLGERISSDLVRIDAREYHLQQLEASPAVLGCM